MMHSLDLAVATLEQTIPLQSLRRIVLTHLTPKRLPSLRMLLERKKEAGGPLDVHLSNPALQLLRSSLGRPLFCSSFCNIALYRPLLVDVYGVVKCPMHVLILHERCHSCATLELAAPA